jgi:hypothetical protein
MRLPRSSRDSPVDAQTSHVASNGLAVLFRASPKRPPVKPKPLFIPGHEAIFLVTRVGPR